MTSMERNPDPASRLRIGLGYDFHVFSSSGRMVLGGVAVPDCPALEGHSDADLLLHAAMDAVLGASGDVDIGALFPDTDPAFRGARSADLARQVAGRLAERGWRIVNLDAVLICDRPKIIPLRARIQAGVADAFGIGADQVNLKGKTREGREGRGEGVEAFVTALLERTQV